MADIKKETSDKLRIDKNLLSQARIEINQAIGMIESLEVIDTPRRSLGYLITLRDLLDWYSQFLTNDVLDPESIYIHNLLNPGVIDNGS